MTKFIVMNREEFNDKRWENYQHALKNREQTAREFDVPESQIIICEPPVNGEVICDICNAEVVTPQIFLTCCQSYVYCKDCVRKDLG